MCNYTQDFDLHISMLEELDGMYYLAFPFQKDNHIISKYIFNEFLSWDTQIWSKKASLGFVDKNVYYRFKRWKWYYKYNV